MKAIEIFERVEKHLLAQNERSVSFNGGACMYWSATGLKCAVGCLITDDAYDSDIEGQGVQWDETVHDVLEKSLGFELSDELLDLLDELQGIHDLRPPRQWPDYLAELRVQVEGGLYD